MNLEGTKFKSVTLFDDRLLRLDREIANHPEVQKLLSKHPVGELELRLAEVASYCEVALDGAYTKEDLYKLADILATKLIAKRIKFIL